MPKVRAYATMMTFLEWEGEIPDDIPEEDWGNWVKENVDGGEFFEPCSLSGDWEWNPVEPELIED